MFQLQVSSLCVGELPSEATVVLIKNRDVLVNFSGINPQFDTTTSALHSISTSTLGGSDYTYIAEVSFTNIAGTTKTTNSVFRFTEFAMQTATTTKIDSCTPDTSITATSLSEYFDKMHFNIVS